MGFMGFNDFVKKYNLRNKATSNTKIRKVPTSIGVDNVNIYLRDGPFSSDMGLVSLHPSKGTHWVSYLNGNYFDSYGCAPPKKLSKFIINQNEFCLNSQYQIQKSDSFCASYRFHFIYLTKVEGIGFKSAVLNLYYRRFS